MVHIIFDRIDRYLRKYDGTNPLALFHYDGKHERISDRIRYLIMLKSNILDFSSLQNIIMGIQFAYK